MARALRIEYPGAFYHVMSRGNEQRDIFKSPKDRERFLSYLESATMRYGAVIHVWCLMSNHYHLLVETPSGNLSQIMRHINGAYTTYFNIKHQRAGHLFQGRYKALLVEADAYAAQLSHYIHLNPVRGGVVTLPVDYPWSSYRCYIGLSPSPDWLTTDLVLGYFGGKTPESKFRYRKFVEGPLCSGEENPLQAAVASTILGSPEFIRDVVGKKLAEKQDERNVPAAKKLALLPSLDAIIAKLEAEFGCDKHLRVISIYCCIKYSGAKLKEIGDRFGISDAAVSQTNRRLVLKCEKDRKLRETLRRAGEILSCVRS